MLLTFFDLSARSHYLNARHTLQKLLRWRVVPVINENDTTTTDEISFGDNDFLAAQVAILLGADRLVMLTETTASTPRTRAGPLGRARGRGHGLELERYDIGMSTSPLGSGGMRSKVVAAEMATAAGIPVTIASGGEPGRGGTGPRGRALGHALPSAGRARVELQALAAYAKPSRGRLAVDEGAERALRERGTSLLPVGVVQVEGEFEAGDAVEVRCDGRSVGKGIVNYSAEELRRIRGLKTERCGSCCRGPPRRPCTATISSLTERVRLRSPYDREIRRLAIPALGALAAEPLYLLADTAMVGHLGTPSWRRWPSPATLITGAFTLFNFLTYGTTAHVARLHGAGEEEAAGRLAAQALWLSVGIGVGLTALLAALAAPLVHLMGGDGRTGDLAVLYLRIGSLGLPFALIALAGQGYLRGVSDLRTPLVIVVVANVANLVLNLVFIYGLDWGLAGSAWATVISQAGMGAAFARACCGAPADSRRPRSRRCGRWPGSAARSSSARPPCTARSSWPARCSRASGTTRWAPPGRVPAVRVPGPGPGRGGDRRPGDRGPGARSGRCRGGAPGARRMIEWAVAAGGVFAVVMLALTDVLPRRLHERSGVIDRLGRSGRCSRSCSRRTGRCSRWTGS